MHERKYKIRDGKLVDRVTEKPIPDNEPLFIFRAQDRKALPALCAYLMILDNLNHKANVNKSIKDFCEFQEKNPQLMKEPDSLRNI